jgi:hypothetical protein
MDPSMHSQEDLHAILGLFEGEISIYERETEKGLGKFMKIRKISNQKYLESERLLKKKNRRIEIGNDAERRALFEWMRSSIDWHRLADICFSADNEEELAFFEATILIWTSAPSDLTF